MKKIIFIATLVSLLVSCGISKKAYIRESTFIDFSEYTRKGFFLTESNSVNFNYEPISSITALVESGYEVLNREGVTSSDAVYGTFSTTRYGEYIRANAQDALDELYHSAIEMGADGIINLKIQFTPLRISSDGKVLSWESYYVSGMAIKRK